MKVKSLEVEDVTRTVQVNTKHLKEIFSILFTEHCVEHRAGAGVETSILTSRVNMERLRKTALADKHTLIIFVLPSSDIMGQLKP